jgi:hypothetical protein
MIELEADKDEPYPLCFIFWIGFIIAFIGVLIGYYYLPIHSKLTRFTYKDNSPGVIYYHNITPISSKLLLSISLPPTITLDDIEIEPNTILSPSVYPDTNNLYILRDLDIL